MFRLTTIWVLGLLMLAGCRAKSSDGDSRTILDLRQISDQRDLNTPVDFGTKDLLEAESLSRRDSESGTVHWFKRITTVASVTKVITTPEGTYIAYFKGDVVFTDQKTKLQRIVYIPPTIFDWVVDLKSKDGYLYMKDGGGSASDWNVRYSPTNSLVEKGDYSDVFPHELTAQDLRCADCTIITVASVADVNLDTRDPNGYVISRIPLQRATVLVGGYRPGDGLFIGGRTFEGNGATADILCLHNCQRLHKGDVYSMRIDHLETHMRRCYAEYGDCWKYDNLPFLWTGPPDHKSAWQVLELCSDQGINCVALSSVDSRE